MISSRSPVDFSFVRRGGSDIRSEVQIWVAKKKFTLEDRPVAVVSFQQPTEAMEAASRSLASGKYVCVHLVLVREALNGLFQYSLSAAGEAVDTNEGDVNETSSPNDVQTFKHEFALTVSA